MSQTRKIAITGGGGQIAYSLVFRLASGEVFGPDTSIELRLIDLPEAIPILEGVKAELEDCCFPLLQSVSYTSDPYIGFADADLVLLLGSKPRQSGMERKDLLLVNGRIFVEQGKALNDVALPTTRVIVVGNPCNTNCLIVQKNAPKMNHWQFFAMTRLDQNRATQLLANRYQRSIEKMGGVIVWGNHSATQVPDASHVISLDSIRKNAEEQHWLENDWISLVQQRGSMVLRLRGKSSAASASQALINTIQDITFAKKGNGWFSCAMLAKSNPYSVTEEIVFSFPCRLEDKSVDIVLNKPWSPSLENRVRLSEAELVEERDMIRFLLP